LIGRGVDALLLLRVNGAAHIIFSLVVFVLDTACECVRSGSKAVTCALILNAGSYRFCLLSLMLDFLRPHGCLLLGAHTRRQQQES
jgi:hypothetical protein